MLLFSKLISLSEIIFTLLTDSLHAFDMTTEDKFQLKLKLTVISFVVLEVIFQLSQSTNSHKSCSRNYIQNLIMMKNER